MTNTTCKNCGGDYGLHQWQTMQCPFGGREAPLGQPDQWTTTTFEPLIDELAALRAEVLGLQNDKEALIEALELVMPMVMAYYKTFPDDGLKQDYFMKEVIEPARHAMEAK